MLATIIGCIQINWEHSHYSEFVCLFCTIWLASGIMELVDKGLLGKLSANIKRDTEEVKSSFVQDKLDSTGASNYSDYSNYVSSQMGAVASQINRTTRFFSYVFKVSIALVILVALASLFCGWTNTLGRGNVYLFIPLSVLLLAWCYAKYQRWRGKRSITKEISAHAYVNKQIDEYNTVQETITEFSKR